MIELTKDADKLLCVLYKEFLTRRNDGFSKSDAARFEDGTLKTFKPIARWVESDISDAMLELARADYLRITIGGDCNLKDEAIIYMEKRFKNGVKDVAAFISQFIPKLL